jgi:hypothetical protein
VAASIKEIIDFLYPADGSAPGTQSPPKSGPGKNTPNSMPAQPAPQTHSNTSSSGAESDSAAKKEPES